MADRPVARGASGPQAGGAILAVVVTVLTLGALSVVAGWFLWARCGLNGCPDIEMMRGYIPDEASVVLDRNGEELTKLYRVRRLLVPLDSLPEHVPAAFVAVEDRRFWEHEGVDWRRVFGAAWVNLRAQRIEQGFSTISMQLARNLFPDALPHEQRTLTRKLAEMRVAFEIEENYGKSQILDLYLNQIYFGHGAWGIEAAAREYFAKSAKDLTLGEAALLAAVPPAPSRLNPRSNLEAAVWGQRLVLRRMMLQGLITTDEAAAALAQPIELSRGDFKVVGRAPYYVEEVRQLMEAELGDAIYTGGYRVYTALDGPVQEAAEQELDRQLAAIEAGRYGRLRGGAAGDRAGRLQGAIVVMDTRTGDVLALVGGRDFEESRFNRATQARRQPGSAFKPIVYAAAVAAGYPTVYTLRDLPIQRVMDDGRIWAPRNYGGSYAGDITMRSALVYSRNVAAVRMAEQLGIARVIAMGRQLGLRTALPEYPSIAIGAAEVRLIELTAAYGAFATLGQRPNPRLVTRVEDRHGRVVWQQQPRLDPALDPAVAFLVTDMLRDVVDHGTGVSVRGAGFHAPAAGKTGTTNDATDVWFVGYTPETLAGVWIGFDRRRTIVAGATGGGLAAPVWARVLARSGRAGGDWQPPAGIERRWVDAFGTVLAAGCPHHDGLRQEYFLTGTAPYGHCPRYDRFTWPDSLAPGRPDRGADRPDGERWWQRLQRRVFPESDPSIPPEPPPGRRQRRPDREPESPPERAPDPALPEPSAPPLDPPRPLHDDDAPSAPPDLLGVPVPDDPTQRTTDAGAGPAPTGAPHERAPPAPR